MEQPYDGLPIFKVQPRDGDGKTKIVDHNPLQPIGENLRHAEAQNYQIRGEETCNSAHVVTTGKSPSVNAMELESDIKKQCHQKWQCANRSFHKWCRHCGSHN